MNNTMNNTPEAATPYADEDLKHLSSAFLSVTYRWRSAKDAASSAVLDACRIFQNYKRLVKQESGQYGDESVLLQLGALQDVRIGAESMSMSCPSAGVPQPVVFLFNTLNLVNTNFPVAFLEAVGRDLKLLRTRMLLDMWAAEESRKGEDESRKGEDESRKGEDVPQELGSNAIDPKKRRLAESLLDVMSLWKRTMPMDRDYSGEDPTGIMPDAEDVWRGAYAECFGHECPKDLTVCRSFDRDPDWTIGVLSHFVAASSAKP
jgi:hypothetical protein